jgi:cytochrome b561
MTSAVDSPLRASVGSVRYPALRRWLHWIIAVGVILMIPGGLVMSNLVPDGPLQDRIFWVHESIGAALLILMVARLAASLSLAAPPPDKLLSPLVRHGSRAVQYTLYLLLFAVPALGWAGTNAFGNPVSLFGAFDFPTILGKDEHMSDQIFEWHLYGALAIGALITLHIGASLYHRFVKRDGLISRITL